MNEYSPYPVYNTDYTLQEVLTVFENIFQSKELEIDQDILRKEAYRFLNYYQQRKTVSYALDQLACHWIDNARYDFKEAIDQAEIKKLEEYEKKEEEPRVYQKESLQEEEGRPMDFDKYLRLKQEWIDEHKSILVPIHILQEITKQCII